MSIFNIFRKPPPPPPPIYKRQPIATAAVILTIVGMFVLGPIGAIYKGLTEELKQKANNETVLLYMKQQKEVDDRQWKAIETQLQQKRTRSAIATGTPKLVLTPEQFEKYLKMPPDIQVKYKEYLKSRGYDVDGL